MQYGDPNPHGYGMQTQRLIAQQRKKRKRKRILQRILIAFVIVLALLVSLVWAFSIQFDSRLAIGGEEGLEVDDEVVKADLSKPFYALLLGSDSREAPSSADASEGVSERSDVIMLVRIDAPNRQITAVSIPRDTPYLLPDGSLSRINEAYNIGGASASIQAVSDLTGVPISYCAEVGFADLEEIVDLLGGVSVDVPVDISYKDALSDDVIELEAGSHVLNGKEAQLFARARHEYSGNQDAARQSNVRVLLSAIIQSVLDKPIYELPGTVLSLADHVGTNMRSSDIVLLASAFAGGSGGMTFYSCTGPSDGGINESAGGKWLCYEDPEGWRELMSVVDAGGDPSEL